MDLDWCKGPDNGLPEPDIILFIDLPSEVAQSRTGYGEERYEKVEFQAKVRKNFNSLMQSKGQAEGGKWKIVDGNRTPDEIFVTVQDILSSELLQKDPQPISTINWSN